MKRIVEKYGHNFDDVRDAVDFETGELLSIMDIYEKCATRAILGVVAGTMKTRSGWQTRLSITA